MHWAGHDGSLGPLSPVEAEEEEEGCSDRCAEVGNFLSRVQRHGRLPSLSVTKSETNFKFQQQQAGVTKESEACTPGKGSRVLGGGSYRIIR